MPGAKIEIGLKKDEASFRSAETSLRSLIATVDKLNVSMGNVSKTIASINTGGRQGAADIKQQVSGKSKGIFGALFGSDDSASMNKMTQSVDQAFSKIENRIKTFVSSVSSQVKGLNGSIGSINVPTGGATAVSGGGGFSGYSYNYGGGGSGAGGYGGGGGGGPTVPNSITPPSPPKPNKPPPQIMDWRQRAAGALLGGATGSMFGGMGGPLGAAVGATTQGMFGGLSRVLAPVMGGVGAGLAAVSLYDKVSKNFEDVRGSRLDYTLDQPFMRLSSAAAAASPFVNMYQATRGRDIHHQMAFRQVMGRKDIMDSVNNVVLRREQLGLKTGELGFSASAMWARGVDWSKAKTADIVTAIGNDMGLDPASKLSQMEIVKNVAAMNAPKDIAAKINAGVQDTKALTVREGGLANEIAGNAMSEFRTAAAAGRSLGFRDIYDRNNPGKVQRIEKYREWKAKLTGAGWEESDDIAGRQQLLGIGAGYERAIGRLSLISANIGGLSNASELVKAGGILGGSVGAGGDFYKRVQGSIGARGLDVAVGREWFGSTSARLMESGQFLGGSAASNYMSSAAGFIGGGPNAPFDVAAQQRRASALTQGTSDLNAYGLGTKAPLYDATNFISSTRIAGGFGITSQILGKLSSEQLAGIRTESDIPQWMKDSGITPEMIEAKKRENSLTTGFNLPIRDGTKVGQLMSEIYEGGKAGKTFADIAEAKVKEKGLKGSAEKAKFLDELAQQYGAGYLASGKGPTLQMGYGIALAQLSVDKRFAGDLQAGGVGRVSPKGLQKVQLLQDMEMKRQDALKIGDFETANRIEAEMVQQTNNMLGSDKVIKSIDKNQFQDLDSIVQSVSTGLYQFASWIKNHGGTIPTRSTPKTAEAQKSEKSPATKSFSKETQAGLSVRHGG